MKSVYIEKSRDVGAMASNVVGHLQLPSSGLSTLICGRIVEDTAAVCIRCCDDHILRRSTPEVQTCRVKRKEYSSNRK